MEEQRLAPDGDPFERFLVDSGDIGRHLSARDWSASSLGSPSGWPRTLRSALRILLTSRFSMWLGWGPELTFFYNDAYRRDTLRSKHPWALGRPAQEVWAEIWDDISPRIDRVLATASATWDEALLLFLERSGYREETYHTFSYSPLTDDEGATAGLLCVVSEDTDRVIGERRMATLRDLAAGLAPAAAEGEVAAAVAQALAANDCDLPFTLTYLLAGDGAARLAAASGVEIGPVAPETIDPGDRSAPWPVAQVLAAVAPLTVDLSHLAGAVPAGAWDDPPRQAMIVPLTPSAGAPVGFLVAGLNPYRELDVSYSGFVELVAGQVASGVARARAQEAEHRRAEALAELDRAKTAFFQNVSHEFRTPLTLILGPLGALAASPLLDSEMSAQAELASANAQRLLKLVNTLLDVSRLEAGHMTAAFQPVDLAALTASLASMFQSAVEGAGLAFVVDCPPLPDVVHVDPSLWEKIVLNLVSNALKFTFEGSIAVAVAIAGGHAELSVTDTGEGIAPEELPHLFARFHRVTGVRARTHEGSGIGLALVQELVALHGGTVAVESEQGAGTAVRVRLPFGTAHLDPTMTGSARAEPVQGEVASAYLAEARSWVNDGEANTRLDGPAAPEAEARRRVLVVDDNAGMRDYVAGLLRSRYDVETAANGAEALAAVARRHPHLVLTDVMMPELDGAGLVAALRADHRTRGLPVIMLSARAGAEAAVEGLEAGADDYLMKPFSGPELMARVGANLAAAAEREEQSRRREQEADRFFDLSLEMMFITDAGGSIVRANPAAEHVLGWSEAELQSRPFTDLVHPEDLPAMAESVAQWSSGREGGVFEIRARTKSGGYRWIMARVRCLPDGVLYCIGADVTERREAEERQRRLAAMHADVLAQVAEGEPLASVLDTLALAVEGMAPGMAASVLLVDDDGATLRHGAAPSLPEAYNRAIDGVAIGPAVGSCGAAAFRGETVVVPDIAADPLWADFADLAAEHGLGACWSTPIGSAAGEVLGTFALYYPTPREPNAEDLALVATATHLARMAIEHAGAGARLRHSEERFRTIATEVPVGVFEADADGAYLFVNEWLCRLTGRPTAELVSRNWADHVHPEDRPRVVSGWDDAVATGTEWASEHRIVAPDGALRHVAAAAVPLGSPARGWLGSYTDVTEARHAEERRIRYEREHLIAQTLQHSLLPRQQPVIPGVELAVRYIAGGAGMDVGGDFYDVFALPGGRVAFAVGDVVGRGLAAAAVMGQMRTALRAVAQMAATPALVVERLSALADDLAPEQMTTLVYGVLDPRSRTLHYACAGHPPPLLRTPAGAADYLEDGRCLPLGIAGSRAQDAVVGLEPGAVVLLYTDGLVERRGTGIGEGLAALAEVVAGHGGDLESLCDRVVEAFDAEGAGDDVAVLALRLLDVAADGLALTMAADPKLLSSLRATLRRWLVDCGAAEEADDVVLAASEAVGNVVVHAYGLEEGVLNLEAQCRDGAVEVIVRDLGSWRPPSPGPGGRGLAMMRSLMDEVEVTAEGDGTRVRLRRELARERTFEVVPFATIDLALATGVADAAWRPTVVAMAGDVDLGSIPALAARLKEAVANPGPGVIVDLSGCTYIDSAGIRLLFEAAQRLSHRRQALRVVVPPESPCRRALVLTGLGEVVALPPTLEHALAQVAADGDGRPENERRSR